MIAINQRSWVLGILMLLAVVLSIYAKPQHHAIDPSMRLSLAEVIPDHFGDWQIDKEITPLQPAPDVQAHLAQLYDQIYAATYANREGQRVMLSIAYGEAQTKATSIHRPEVCYPAQGFEIRNTLKDQINTREGPIKAMRLVAVLNQRVEPITYWIRVGDKIARGWFEQKMLEISYGLTGGVPDGLLFRVSTITTETVDAYKMHDVFIRDLLTSLNTQRRQFLVGNLAVE